jgi:hypothetical protein
MTPEERRAEAERLAGPHDYECCLHHEVIKHFGCGCDQPSRVARIFSALEDAEKTWKREAEDWERCVNEFGHPIQPDHAHHEVRDWLNDAFKAGEEKQRAEVERLKVLLGAVTNVLDTYIDPTKGLPHDRVFLLGQRAEAAEARVVELEKEAANVAHFTRHREDVAQAKAEGKREGVELMRQATVRCALDWGASDPVVMGIPADQFLAKYGAEELTDAIRALLAPEAGKEECGDHKFTCIEPFEEPKR